MGAGGGLLGLPGARVTGCAAIPELEYPRRRRSSRNHFLAATRTTAKRGQLGRVAQAVPVGPPCPLPHTPDFRQSFGGPDSLTLSTSVDEERLACRRPDASGRPGLVLVVLSVVEQRLDAVRAVLAGSDVTEVAAGIGVHRSTVHRWVSRYLAEQLAGLVDRSHRPVSSPAQVADAVEVPVAEMRREHPRWGSRRIRLEMLRRPGPWFRGDLEVPSQRTIDRILQRQGLLRSRPRKRPKESFVRWERPAAMQLWQLDIVGGVQLVDRATGVLREAKLVTSVDDHSRFCVIAKVVERATARAVCLALAEALTRFGVPEEIITDNGKQFTDRFGKYRPRTGEVLFDKICRKNGITHRLTAPASPNQNGKVERFHGTLRPEFLDAAGPFTSVEQAQAAVDAYVDRGSQPPIGSARTAVPPSLTSEPGQLVPDNRVRDRHYAEQAVVQKLAKRAYQDPNGSRYRGAATEQNQPGWQGHELRGKRNPARILNHGQGDNDEGVGGRADIEPHAVGPSALSRCRRLCHPVSRARLTTTRAESARE